MACLKFDDCKIKNAYRNIAGHSGSHKKIDSELEKQMLSDFIKNNESRISKHDLALLQSSLNGASNKFDNKQAKKAYNKISGYNNNHRLDTAAEIKAAEDFLLKNQNYLPDTDIELLRNLIKSSKTTSEIVVNINGDNNNVIIFVNNGETEQQITPKEHEETETPVSTSLAPETPQPVSTFEEPAEEDPAIVSEDKSANQAEVVAEKKYTIKSGDYWYKMILENYNVSSHEEIMLIVRKFKSEYFANNEQVLRSKGYTSSKDAFMIKKGTEITLPNNIEINGKKFTLK